jgi:hypothetical protein
MIRKAGGMRLRAWSGAAESPYATGDYRKHQRDGDAAVGGLDLTHCGRYDSTGPKNNGCLWQVQMRSYVVQADLATVVFLVCFILITGIESLFPSSMLYLKRSILASSLVPWCHVSYLNSVHIN